MADPVDDCWRRIGVQGDGSCERLPALSHCRYCPAYARAAAAWLDSRAAHVLAETPCNGEVAVEDQPDHDAADIADRAPDHTPPLVIFRVGSEWLALPARALQEILPTAPAHSLPHQRNRAVLGIVNVHGSLLVCVSLARLLGLEEVSAEDNGEGRDAGGRPRSERMLIVGGCSGTMQGAMPDTMPVAVPVDEVATTARVPAASLRPLPNTVGRAAGHLTEALLVYQNRTVGLLDPRRLHEALDRSVA